MELSHPDGRMHVLDLPPRSLLVMTGEARAIWQHAIPGRKSDPLPDGERRLRQRRLSLTFRLVRKQLS
jgi:alkylated DNA repair dioxygenase AlkB